MYNKQLDAFLMAAKTGSFSKASQVLYITPSAVIQQINNLERDLGVSLFVRTKRGISLTPAGEYLFKEGEALVRLCDDIRSHLHVLEKEEKPEICVGTTLLMK